jgi:hypothetical protein
MAVHAVEPRCDPAAARFEKGDPDFRMTFADAAQITLMQASIISIVCEMMCCAPRPSKRSTPTVGMPLDAPSWKSIEKSRSSAAAQNGS